MARKKPNAVVILEQKGVEIVDIDPLGIETTPRESVRRVSVEGARELLTVPPDAPIWGGSPPSYRTKVAGAIVRLRPPEKATDDDVEEIRKFFLGKGAAKVTVLPRPRAELLPSKVEKAKAVGAREAVTALVAESNSRDRESLHRLCEKIMGEVGL